ncbi:Bug family tripartite tricarboxylate transporter substrate binding protein [Bordetella sp. 02P26C-1]|uniref:Bug family tripartite tricarboxylate transporter substrate binding protein n=1 Tax=Bordetella sp. 02P26C-1 TaxID=2683195 RepID=UPI0013552871|nr:tripartite tricarboxylate transporter substrate binding protein [Bordetella sp. 02P26C-1]MVW77620.1 tripartite tricarboxylate transporter substrate binding protein [Bordetella sp. 02P26C-1]
MDKRTFLGVWAAAALLTALPAAAQHSQAPTRIVVSFSAGGPVDMAARIVAEQLSKELNRPVIVDNKPGASGFLGAQEVLRAPVDGNTIWISSVGTAAINPSLFETIPYNTQKNFRPVSLIANNVEVFVVNPKVPARNASEFVEYSRKQPEPPAIASSGIGGIPHLAMLQLKPSTGVNFLHVPYRGMAQAITDVIGGQAAGVFADVAAVLPHIEAGRLRPVGIAAAQRHPALPDVPTFEEQGIAAVDSNNWYALFVPAQTPDNIVADLNAAVGKALANDALRDRLVRAGTQPQASTEAEMKQLLDADTAKWGALIKANNIKPE